MLSLPLAHTEVTGKPTSGRMSLSVSCLRMSLNVSYLRMFLSKPGLQYNEILKEAA